MRLYAISLSRACVSKDTMIFVHYLVGMVRQFISCRYDAVVLGAFSQSFIMNELQQHWQKGVRVRRCMGPEKHTGRRRP